MSDNSWKESIKEFWKLLDYEDHPANKKNKYDIIRKMETHNKLIMRPLEQMGFDYNIWIKGDQNRFFVWFKTGVEGDDFFSGEYKRECKIEDNQILLASLKGVLHWLKENKIDKDKFKELIKK